MEVKEGRGDFSGDSLLSINGSPLPTVILPSGSLLVILEPGHASDIRFTGGQASGGRVEAHAFRKLPAAHICLFLAGTSFMVPCVSYPTSQWGILTGLSVPIKQQGP